MSCPVADNCWFTFPWELPITYPAGWGNIERLSLDNTRWSGRLGFPSPSGCVVAVIRIFHRVIAGVQPEAWALTAMMTAPFTVGAVSLFTLVTALMETWLRRRRSAGMRIRSDAVHGVKSLLKS